MPLVLVNFWFFVYRRISSRQFEKLLFILSIPSHDNNVINWKPNEVYTFWLIGRVWIPCSIQAVEEEKWFSVTLRRAYRICVFYIFELTISVTFVQCARLDIWFFVIFGTRWCIVIRFNTIDGRSCMVWDGRTAVTGGGDYRFVNWRSEFDTARCQWTLGNDKTCQFDWRIQANNSEVCTMFVVCIWKWENMYVVIFGCLCVRVFNHHLKNFAATQLINALFISR